MMGLFGSGRRLAALTSELARLRDEVRQLAEENQRLEGLLDGLASDPDEGLSGASDPRLYRSGLSAGAEWGTRDLPASKREEIRRLSHLTYALRGDAQNLVEIVVDYVLGATGLRPVALDGAGGLQDVLDAIWLWGPMPMRDRQEAALLSLLLDGERFVAAEMLEGGVLSHSWIAPERVDRVLVDPSGRVTEILVRDEENPGTNPYRLFALDGFDPDATSIERLPSDEKNARYAVRTSYMDRDGRARDKVTRYHGLAFAWLFRAPEGATRGRPLLQPVLDYVDAHDELIWSSVEREKLLSRYLIDVTVSDGSIKTPADARKILRDLGLTRPPEGPTTIAHSENISLGFLGPDTSARPMETLEKVLGTNIYGSLGFPAHFRGDGSDANLATAKAQESVPMRRLQRIQAAVIRNFHSMVRASVALRVQQKSAAIDIGIIDDFRFEAAEVGGKDRQGLATMIRDLGTALIAAVSQKILLPEAANAVIVQAIRAAGFDLPDDIADLPEEPEGMGPDALSRLADRLGLGQEGPNER